MQKSDYRPDIDGLRAVAVLPVLLFHFDIPPFTGGFVGVDVFFVISGYLITRVILRHEGPIRSFFVPFYESRVRRLVPPAIPVLIFCCAFVYAWFPPDALQEFARSLLANTVFLSNWFFWSIGGYFDTEVATKPLLHTWSLAIEEQFYILFPVCILALKARGMRLVVVFFGAIFALSLALNMHLTASGGDAYYNSFSRFWEIALGSLLALGLVKSPSNETAKSVVGGIGLALILIAVFYLDREAAFPGWWALLPTFGAAMIILARGGLVGRLLSTKPFVWIGLISYALYLWHWPIAVAFRTYFITPTVWQMAGGALLSVALAAASYPFEKAIRQGVRRDRGWLRPRRAAFGLLAASTAAFVVLGTTGTTGLPWRYPDSVVNYAERLETELVNWRKATLHNVCFLAPNRALKPAIPGCVSKPDGRPRMLLIGDSHAAHLYPGMKAVFTDYQVDLLAAASCVLPRSSAPNIKPSCKDLVTWLDTDLAKAAYDVVVVSTRAPHVKYTKALIARVREISRLTRGKVVVFGPIQFYQPNIPTAYPGIATLPQGEIVAALDKLVQKEQFVFDGTLNKALRKSPVKYVSLLSVACPKRRCRHFDSTGFPITIDNTHLSIRASEELIRDARPAIDAAIR